MRSSLPGARHPILQAIVQLRLLGLLDQGRKLRQGRRNSIFSCPKDSVLDTRELTILTVNVRYGERRPAAQGRFLTCRESANTGRSLSIGSSSGQLPAESKTCTGNLGNNSL